MFPIKRRKLVWYECERCTRKVMSSEEYWTGLCDRCRDDEATEPDERPTRR